MGHWLEPLSSCRIRVGQNVLDRAHYSRTRIGYQSIRARELATNWLLTDSRTRIGYERIRIVDRNANRIVDRNVDRNLDRIVDRIMDRIVWLPIHLGRSFGY